MQRRPIAQRRSLGQATTMTVKISASSAPSRLRRVMVLSASVLAAAVFELNLTNISVVLPHMQGAFSATQDQVSWVVTAFFVGMIVGFAWSGWAADRFGRKQVFMLANLGFVVATFMCGASDTLGSEVAWRFGQGFWGGPLMPLSQALVLDSFPRRQHGFANAIWGIGVMMGPALGPPFGGFITQHWEWHWIFYACLPAAGVATALCWIFVPKTEGRPERAFDLIGFTALILAVIAAQLALNRGERLDWFASTEIILEVAAAAFFFYILVVQTLTARNPFIEPGIFRDRNAATGLAITVIWGFTLHGPLVLTALLLQELRGMPVMTIGIIMSPRGLGVMAGMFLAAQVIKRVDPRYMIAFGMGTLALSSWFMSQWTMAIGAWDVMWLTTMQGFSTGFSFVPLSTKTFSTLPRRYRTEGLTVFNLILFQAISAGIAVAMNVLTRTSQASRASLTEFVSPYAAHSKLLPESWDFGTMSGLASIEAEVMRQAAMIGYLNNFKMIAIMAACAIPAVFLFTKGRITGNETADD